ncbi:GGDEF domain-containing protein [Saccharopolyspora erythraea]|uniref:GGDEF domain-containing protein n=1 Tax=Saccharopolyspora erythraea TaxID=1836 RepID=UPI001BA60E83|nr:GGDEF domain-containing protein [Saccharopolyspora erythraea]QUH05405.1 GGDEF domain-containing protein [Saccharopolyspora erythraea]
MLAEIALSVSSGATGAGLLYGLHARSLARRLHTDRLTGLANRDALERAYTRHARRHPGHRVGLLVGDVDHFKTYNDTHGHFFGDSVLVCIARALTDTARPGELPVRLHGDEFAVLLTGLRPWESPEDRLGEYTTAIEAIRTVNGLPTRVSLSLGAAVDTASAVDLSTLMGRADRFMYGRKHSAPDRAPLTVQHVIAHRSADSERKSS